jgi:hypothetical protein
MESECNAVMAEEKRSEKFLKSMWIPRKAMIGLRPGGSITACNGRQSACGKSYSLCERWVFVNLGQAVTVRASLPT